MALIKCPECEANISSKAENCPHCGFPIKKKQLVVKKQEGCFMQTLNLGCLSVVVIFLLIMLSYAASSFLTSKTKPKNETKNIIHNNTERGRR